MDFTINSYASISMFTTLIFDLLHEIINFLPGHGNELLAGFSHPIEQYNTAILQLGNLHFQSWFLTKHLKCIFPFIG